MPPLIGDAPAMPDARGPGPPSSKSQLAALPTEVLWKICSYLPSTHHADRIQILRLTCREISSKCMRPHAKAKFMTICSSFSKEDLELLRRLSKNSLVAESARELVLDFTCVNKEYTDAVTARIPKIFFAEDKIRRYDESWVSNAEEECIHHTSAAHASLLTIILHNLSKVSSVRLDGHQLVVTHAGLVPTPFTTWIFPAFFSALAAAGSKITSLQLSDDYLNICDDNRHGWVNGALAFWSLDGLRSIRHLRFTFKPYGMLPGNPRACFRHLVTLVKSAPNLSSLVLNLKDSYHYDVGGILEILPLTIRYLHLGYVRTDVHRFMVFLANRHTDELALSLQSCSLSEGSWKTILEYLRQKPVLKSLDMFRGMIDPRGFVLFAWPERYGCPEFATVEDGVSSHIDRCGGGWTKVSWVEDDGSLLDEVFEEKGLNAALDDMISGFKVSLR